MPKLIETTEDIQIEIPNEKIVDCEYGAYIPILAFTDTATYSFFQEKGLIVKQENLLTVILQFLNCLIFQQTALFIKNHTQLYAKIFQMDFLQKCHTKY